MDDDFQNADTILPPLRGNDLALSKEGGTFAIVKAKIDSAIATARSFPRDPVKAQKDMVRWATMDDQTAEECIYSLKRDGKTIRGGSIRLAEIICLAWGHIRVDAFIVEEGRDFIKLAGEAHDMQSNTQFRQEILRRIVNSKGIRYGVDMIGTTAMAAASIAQRDSILKCVPRFIWRPAYEAALQRIAGDARTLADRRVKAVGQFSLMGVTAEQVLRYLEVPSINDITAEHLVDMVGVFNALREGEQTIESVFGETKITGGLAKVSPFTAKADEPAAKDGAAGTAETAQDGQTASKGSEVPPKAETAASEAPTSRKRQSKKAPEPKQEPVSDKEPETEQAKEPDVPAESKPTEQQRPNVLEEFKQALAECQDVNDVMDVGRGYKAIQEDLVNVDPEQAQAMLDAYQKRANEFKPAQVVEANPPQEEQQVAQNAVPTWPSEVEGKVAAHDPIVRELSVYIWNATSADMVEARWTETEGKRKDLEPTARMAINKVRFFANNRYRD